jgi:hypothetical protein
VTTLQYNRTSSSCDWRYAVRTSGAGRPAVELKVGRDESIEAPLTVRFEWNSVLGLWVVVFAVCLRLRRRRSGLVDFSQAAVVDY